MNNPELVVVVINVVFTGFAYLVVYPYSVGANRRRLATHDAVISLMALGSAGVLFWDTGVRFSLIFIDVNWFWFTLITYSLIEAPQMLRYMKQRGMRFGLPQ